MPIYRLQTEWMFDSGLPRDVLTITPHFNDGGVGSDPQNLCDDLADALNSKAGIILGQVEVTAYVANDAPPSYPVAYAIRNQGVAPQSPHPREVALCLSFFSQRNIPRQRGRLFIPAAHVAPANTVGVRPSLTQQNLALSFAPIFADLGGVDVDWVVYSRMNAEAYPVTDCWVDNEWDTMRSRGLRSTSRVSAAVGEG